MNGVRVLTQTNRRLDEEDPGSIFAELAKIEAKAEEIESLFRDLSRVQDDD